MADDQFDNDSWVSCVALFLCWIQQKQVSAGIRQSKRQSSMVDASKQYAGAGRQQQPATAATGNALSDDNQVLTYIK